MAAMCDDVMILELAYAPSLDVEVVRPSWLFIMFGDRNNESKASPQSVHSTRIVIIYSYHVVVVDRCVMLHSILAWCAVISQKCRKSLM